MFIMGRKEDKMEVSVVGMSNTDLAELQTKMPDLKMGNLLESDIPTAEIELPGITLRFTGRKKP